MVECKEKEFLNGKIIQNMMDSTGIIESMVLVNIYAMMEKYMKVNGKMVLDMDKVT